MNSSRFRAAVLIMVLLLQPGLLSAEDFDAWLQAFKPYARELGISEQTLEQAFVDAKPIERVVELDQSQPEFIQTFTTYLQRRVTPKQISRGQQLQSEQGALLQAVQARYGIPAQVLLAFWSLETNYGQTRGNFLVPHALATLAYEGRRQAFFQSQLVDALRIIDQGHIAASDMLGSWAGALGHMQFMPSTFLAYAVDGDGDGKIDVWNSTADAMHSAGHYLQAMGWQGSKPMMVEVVLPENFAWQDTGLGNRRSVSAWMQAGVSLAMPDALPASFLAGNDQAAVVLPQGWQGPAFMVFDNFNIIMKWNRSTLYALSVAHLASRLAGGPALQGGQLAEQEAVSIEAIKRLQQQLTSLGFDTEGHDGLPGPKTQAAIRAYQLAHGLHADAYASPSLIQEVARAAALAQEQTELIPGFPGTMP